MATKITVAGKTEVGETTLGAGGIGLVPKGRVRPGARADEAPLVVEMEDGDAVGVEFAGGFKLWMRVDEARRRFGGAVSRDPQGGEVWQVTPVLRGPGAERGAVAVAIEALDFVGVDLAGKTAETVARWAEDKLLDSCGAGIYRLALTADGDFMTLAADGLLPAGGPLLVFLHGTASSTVGSFGELWAAGNPAGAEARRALAARYGERAFALEHRTLTESPIDNALALAERLPPNAELHLVSHSRGGLVGELLCLVHRAGTVNWEAFAALFAEDRTLAESMGLTGKRGGGYTAQWEKLKKLIRTLEEKRVRVGRFVRVACPARGTTLAAGRLDRWLSIINSFGFGTVVDGFLDFLLAVVQERTDPRSLPGLEAMMPGSALVRFLNQPGLKVDADLSVIAGDIEDDGILGRLALALPDLFFDGDHDLVVNTGSMYGGLPRNGDGGRFFFDRGPGVSHFKYFVNAETVEKLRQGLLRADASLAGFTPLARAAHAEPGREAAARREAAGPRPLAIVLPGIMGSHLHVNGTRVWLDVGKLMDGGFGRLAIDAAAVRADIPLERAYGDFIKYLERSHAVLPFAYDWRQSVLAAADRLADEIAARLPAQEASGQPIRLVAHSMGGLVARAMIARRPDLWRRMKAISGCRLLMLGTPNAGSYQAVRLVVGQHRLANLLALADFRHGRDDILRILGRFPGAMELLPALDGRDFSALGTWQELARQAQESWPLPDRATLDGARATWAVLRDSPIDPHCMTYVAGWARQTAIGCEIGIDDGNPYLGPRPCVRFPSTRRGDGTVPWDLGVLAGVKTWYVEGAEHDALPGHEPAFAAYLDILQTGRTERLPDSEPAVSRSAALAEDREYLPADPPPLFPAEGDFGGFGGGLPERRGAGRDRRLARVRVAVRHGDLRYAHHPVCVGHYAGDTVVNAERELDQALDGALRREQRMGLYPSRLGTWKVFIHPLHGARPAGAIVIGLGQVGELSPGELESTLARALMDYALKVADWQGGRFGPANAPRSAAVSFLLVGTGAGGMTVRDSVETILRAVKKANEQLAAAELDDKVLIDRIELLELFQDIAIQAASALAAVLRDHELASAFDWERREVEKGDGGRVRTRCDEASNWWQRLEIAHDRKRDELRFIALTNRARAEESLVSGQMRLADDFIREATGRTDNDRDISRTLFEMLLPNRLKEFAPERLDLVLVVDEISARYPWELLEDRWTDGNPPLAVAAGMVRQLKTPVYRPRPLHALENTAYVVGNPKLAGTGKPAVPDACAELAAKVDPSRLLLPDLPGARAEADEVASLLKRLGNYQVREEIDADADRIMIGLHAGAYRILHLAGHGVHDWETEYDDGHPNPCPVCEQKVPKARKNVSGMVIGDGVFLTPGDVEQMRWVPELVFINCCHLGNSGVTAEYARYNRLAASVAIQFIRMGVKAVVAAGWAVNDAAARAFAAAFYGALLRGEPFGRAVQAARKRIHDDFGNFNTWGAYQCYGDPDFRLVADGNGAADGAVPPFLSPAELVADLDNLRSAARMGRGEARDIDRLLARIPAGRGQDWLDRADVGEALGLAYGEFGEFVEAIRVLDKAAVKEGEKQLSARTLEQRANYKARLGRELAKHDPAQAQRLLDNSVRELNTLLQLGDTTERHNLLASTYKRQAMTFAEGRGEALKKMTEEYWVANELFRQRKPGEVDTYSLLNGLIGTLLITANADLDRLLTGCAEAKDWARAQDGISPCFWNSIAIPESLLIEALVRHDLADRQEAIVDSYRQAKKRGASKREFDSILDQFDFLETVVPDCPHLAGQLPALQGIAAKLRMLR